MKTYFILPSYGQLRWTFSVFIEKTGKWSLVVFLITLWLFLYWGKILHPAQLSLQNEINRIQQQLSVSLPLHADKREALKSSLSVTEYEQVKILFDTFHRYQIHIVSGNYHFPSDNENGEKALHLTIPLQGEWLALANAMDDITRMIPVEIKSLTLSRNSPEMKPLSITLQLILHRGKE